TAHADAIAGKLQADISEHKSLIREATVAREALAEADLRHAVGEYDDARHESERVRHVADLEAYEVSIAAVADRVGRLEEVFAVVNRVPVAPVQPQSSAPGTPAPQAPVTPAWREAEAPVNIDDLAPSQPDDDADEGLLAIF